MHALQIAADRLGNEWPRAVHPGGDPHGAPARDIAAKARRDFDAGTDTPVFEPPLEIGIIGERGFFEKIGRATHLFEIGPALVALVAVEDCEREVVDVGRDPKAEDQHQKGCTEKREPQPDWVAQEFQRFADRAGKKTLSTERPLDCVSTRSLRRLQDGPCYWGDRR